MYSYASMYASGFGVIADLGANNKFCQECEEKETLVELKTVAATLNIGIKNSQQGKNKSGI